MWLCLRVNKFRNAHCVFRGLEQLYGRGQEGCVCCEPRRSSCVVSVSAEELTVRCPGFVPRPSADVGVPHLECFEAGYTVNTRYIQERCPIYKSVRHVSNTLAARTQCRGLSCHVCDKAHVPPKQLALNCGLVRPTTCAQASRKGNCPHVWTPGMANPGQSRSVAEGPRHKLRFTQDRPRERSWMRRPSWRCCHRRP